MAASSTRSSAPLPRALSGTQTWYAPAALGAAVFAIGYVLPRVVAGHAVGMMQWPATGVTFLLVALAIFRALSGREGAPDGSGAALSDGAVRADTLDAVVASTIAGDASKPRRWSLDLLQSLEWKRMADVCLAFHAEKGLFGEAKTVSADGSVDIPLFQTSETQGAVPYALLHCRARGGVPVGVEAVFALHARMSKLGVARAFFMGAWYFDDAARAAAKPLQIKLVDQQAFLVLISRLTPEVRQRLLNFAVEGDYATPTCPACGLKMIPRQNEDGRYWGCRAFPRCKTTLGLVG